ncbi:MAG: hypothetical protein LH468_13320 [Nocardioides sp.]|nr:hypothetical protein [Nocardioides sp.]
MRQSLARLCALLACLLLPLALVSAWASERVIDTDAYVAAVTPLADDPAVREAARELLLDRAADVLSLGDLSDEEVLVARPVVARAVAAVVRGAEFRRVWVDANRVAHHEAVRLTQSLQTTGLVAPGVSVAVLLLALVAGRRGPRVV